MMRRVWRVVVLWCICLAVAAPRRGIRQRLEQETEGPPPTGEARGHAPEGSAERGEPHQRVREGPVVREGSRARVTEGQGVRESRRRTGMREGQVVREGSRVRATEGQGVRDESRTRMREGLAEREKPLKRARRCTYTRRSS